ncbi:hypothetical protein ACH4Y0_33070 [Streptomyces sp. NPDC020707]|uniref:hypothetical protein n=1 Tax=Streptomyces TaxID=1883 RepID=UPI0028D10924|nr:hypothetical protein [Streptomyces sp. DSM 40484]
MTKWRNGSGTPPGIDLCLAALHQRGVSGTMAAVGAFRTTYPDYELSDSMVRSMLNGTREPKPDFVHRLARLADVPVTQVFAHLGWLPPEEAADPSVLHLVRQLRTGITAAGQLAQDAAEPWFDRAPAAAAAAVLTNEDGARRYTVSLSAVESGEHYRCALMDIAEFHLRPGARPLSREQAVALADSGLLRGTLAAARRQELAEHPDYWSVRLELTALAQRALQYRGEYSWQGQPGARLWLNADDGYRPRHLLVQDRIAGVHREPVPAAARQWADRAIPPIVVIGHRPLAGGAAALLAEALGLEYVLPRSGEEIVADGLFLPVLRSPVPGRVEAWLSVMRYLRTRSAAEDPWPAVVLTRPYVFAGQGHDADLALDELCRLPAHVVSVRPSGTTLRWWAARRTNSETAGDAEAQAWVARELRAYDRIESVLSARPADRTLLIRVPEPTNPLRVQGWGWPDIVADLQPRLAWAVLKWLDLTARRQGPRLSGMLRPGLLSGWAPTLRDDPGVSLLMPR